MDRDGGMGGPVVKKKLIRHDGKKIGCFRIQFKTEDAKIHGLRAALVF